MPRFHLALKTAVICCARTGRAEVRNTRECSLSRAFSGTLRLRNIRSAAECRRGIRRRLARDGNRAPRNGRRRSGVRRFAYADPKVFCAIGTGGASGNALRILRSPPPLQRSFNGLIISFPKISGIWGFPKFSFIFPKSNFAIMHAAPGGENFGTAPAAVRGMRRALIASGTWAERRPKRRFYAVPARPPAGFPQNRFAGRCVSNFFREAAARFPPAFRPEEKSGKFACNLCN